MAQFSKKIIGFGYFVALITVMSAPFLLLAIDYTPLVSLPGVSTSKAITLKEYLPAIYKFLIGAATILAVMMIVYGGFQLMISETPFKRGQAKETIQNAVWGLLLAILSYLILYTINPNLVKINF